MEDTHWNQKTLVRPFSRGQVACNYLFREFSSYAFIVLEFAISLVLDRWILGFIVDPVVMLLRK